MKTTTNGHEGTRIEFKQQDRGKKSRVFDPFVCLRAHSWFKFRHYQTARYGRGHLLRQDRGVSQTSTEKALRAHLHSHNLAVLAASGGAIFFSAIGWAALYGISHWVTLIVITLGSNGGGEMPAIFNSVFFGTAAVLMLASRVDQWFFPDERAVDERPPAEHLADILFFVPRFTMSCWQNLGALAWLSADELPDAARLLDHLKIADRIPLQELPAMISGERRMHRLLGALLVTALVDQRREGSLTWIHVGALAPDVFRSKKGALPAPEDPLASVPQVKIRRRVRLLPPQEDGADGQ